VRSASSRLLRHKTTTFMLTLPTFVGPVIFTKLTLLFLPFPLLDLGLVSFGDGRPCLSVPTNNKFLCLRCGSSASIASRMSASLPALVIGGSGALGKVLVSRLVHHSIPVISVDIGSKNVSDHERL